MILYYLIFRKNLKLLIKEITLLEITILDKMIILVHKIFLFRKNIKIAINKT